MFYVLGYHFALFSARSMRDWRGQRVGRNDFRFVLQRERWPDTRWCRLLSFLFDIGVCECYSCSSIRPKKIINSAIDMSINMDTYLKRNLKILMVISTHWKNIFVINSSYNIFYVKLSVFIEPIRKLNNNLPLYWKFCVSM